METLPVAKRDLVIARVLDRLGDGRITTALAARELGKSSRQIRRLRRRYEQAGIEGLRSGHLGRTAANRLEVGVRERALSAVRALYPDFGPTLANEKLRAEHGLALSTESLRQLMIGDGLWRTAGANATCINRANVVRTTGNSYRSTDRLTIGSKAADRDAPCSWRSTTLRAPICICCS